MSSAGPEGKPGPLGPATCPKGQTGSTVERHAVHIGIKLVSGQELVGRNLKIVSSAAGNLSLATLLHVELSHIRAANLSSNLPIISNPSFKPYMMLVPNQRCIFTSKMLVSVFNLPVSVELAYLENLKLVEE